jgi:hypothetical protein
LQKLRKKIIEMEEGLPAVKSEKCEKRVISMPGIDVS